MLFEPYVRFHIFSSVRVAGWPPVGEWLLTRLTWCGCLCVILFMEREFLSDCAIS